MIKTKNVKKINFRYIEELDNKNSSSGVLRKSLNILKIDNKNIMQYILSILFSIIIGIIVALRNDGVSVFCEISKSVTEINLVILGIVFTGYSILSAIMSNDLIVQLLNNDNEKSLLNIINEYFLQIVMYNLFIVIVNILVRIVCCLLTKEYYLPFNFIINNTLFFIAVSTYIYVNIIGVFEIKCFICNLQNVMKMQILGKVKEMHENNEIEFILDDKK